MSRILPALASALLFLSPVLGSSPTAEAAGVNFCVPGQSPHYVFGFADLQARLGDAMGTAASCEFPDPNGTGDVHQRTAKGLAFWRKRSNTPTFTNGSEHWALTSRGLVYWTGSSIDPTASAVPLADNSFAQTTPPATVGSAPAFQGFPANDCTESTWGAYISEICFYNTARGLISADWVPFPDGWIMVANISEPNGPAAMTNEGRRLAGPRPSAATAIPATPVASDYAPVTLPAPSGAIVESRIDGEFTGWTGETVFKLQNGQIWQQATYAYHYHYAYSPTVLITPSSSGWRMQVEGDSESVQVVRLR